MAKKRERGQSRIRQSSPHSWKRVEALLNRLAAENPAVLHRLLRLGLTSLTRQEMQIADKITATTRPENTHPQSPVPARLISWETPRYVRNTKRVSISGRLFAPDGVRITVRQGAKR